jgi:ABC-2 type transport system permease protein
VQTAVVLTLARGLFDVPMEGGWLTLSLGTLLFILGSLALGFLISTVAKSQLQAMQMSFFYMLPSILLSGFAFPFRGMPDWAQVIGTALPVTHFLRVVRGALLKGQGIGDIWPSLSALAVFVTAVTILAMARYRTTLD